MSARRAVEIIMPAITTERADPVRSGGTITVAAPTAVGEYMAARKPARALVLRSLEQLVERLFRRLPVVQR